jgi:hypothetical protein
VLDQQENVLSGISIEGAILSYDLLKNQVMCETTIKEHAVGLAAGKEGILYALFTNLLVLIKDGQIIKEQKLKFANTCIDYNYATNEVYTGDSLVSVYKFILLFLPINITIRKVLFMFLMEKQLNSNTI